MPCDTYAPQEPRGSQEACCSWLAPAHTCAWIEPINRANSCVCVCVPLQLKEENLPFEGFLEALCRMATVKVLPTDDEVSDNGCSDAGTYIRWLELNDRIALSRLQNERACEFGQWPDQPLHRCVDHLIHMIIRTIENTDESGGGSVVLSAAEFKLWAQDSGFAKRNWR